MEAAKGGWRQIRERLPARLRVLCEFTEKLTVSPGRMSREDLQALREVGLSDGEIVEAVHVIGYFNHINRVADALDDCASELLDHYYAAGDSAQGSVLNSGVAGRPSDRPERPAGRKARAR